MPINFDLFAYRGSVFVETGTGDGASVITAMRLQFPLIHSIELAPEKRAMAAQAVETETQTRPSRSEISLHEGKSVDFLPQICEQFRYQLGANKSQHTAFFTFWLDAHQASEAGATANPWPVLDELQVIQTYFKGALRPPAIFINHLEWMDQPDALGGHDVSLEKVARIVHATHPSYGYHVLPGDNETSNVLAIIPMWLRAANSYP